MKHELIEMLESQLRANLDTQRFIHTQGVAYTCAALAMKWHKYEVDRAMIAGYLHDCAKCMSYEEQLGVADENMIYITDYQMKNPKLLHAVVGPTVAQEQYGIFDREIQDAIRTHTTGAPNMSIFQKIVFVADFIEPNRETPVLRMENFREMAFTDIDKAVFMIADRTVEYLASKGSDFDPATVATRDYYKKLIEERDQEGT